MKLSGISKFVAAGLLVAAPFSAEAATIIVGSNQLLPNTANQSILIQISGAEQVAGLDFFAQIGDGGAFNNGTNTKPVFQNVDILTGTIFASSNKGQFGDTNTPGGNAAHPLIWLDGTTTNPPGSPATVTDNGLFATLTVSTVGLSTGTFPLLLTGVANNLGTFNTKLTNSVGGTVPLAIINGTISVPEPTMVGLIGLVPMMLLGRRRRGC